MRLGECSARAMNQCWATPNIIIHAPLQNNTWFVWIFYYRVLAQRRQHTLGNRSDKPRPPIGPRLCVQIILDPQPRAKKWALDWHSLRPSQPVLLLGTNKSTQMKVRERYPPSCAKMSPKVRGDNVSHWPCQWKARPSGMVDGQVM